MCAVLAFGDAVFNRVPFGAKGEQRWGGEQENAHGTLLSLRQVSPRELRASKDAKKHGEVKYNIAKGARRDGIKSRCSPLPYHGYETKACLIVPQSPKHLQYVQADVFIVKTTTTRRWRKF